MALNLLEDKCSGSPGVRKKVNEMKKGMRITGVVLVAALVFAGTVWGQKGVPLASFSGTITRIDSAGKEIVLQKNKAETIFRWNDQTSVKGRREGNLRLEDLKEGMVVTVLYKEGDPNRVAARIDVTETNPRASKGINFPFVCGVRVC